MSVLSVPSLSIFPIVNLASQYPFLASRPGRPLLSVDVFSTTSTSLGPGLFLFSFLFFFLLLCQLFLPQPYLVISCLSTTNTLAPLGVPRGNIRCSVLSVKPTPEIILFSFSAFFFSGFSSFSFSFSFLVFYSIVCLRCPSCFLSFSSFNILSFSSSLISSLLHTIHSSPSYPHFASQLIHPIPSYPSNTTLASLSATPGTLELNHKARLHRLAHLLTHTSPLIHIITNEHI